MDALKQGDGGGGAVVDLNELMSVSEGGFEPVKSRASDVGGCL